MTENIETFFFELVRAGLWEKEVRLLPYGKMDYAKVLQLAEEQSVVGLVAAGLEQLDIKCKKENVSNIVPKQIVLQIIGQTVSLEQKNKAMNHFVGELFNNMRKYDIYALLVKGQGVAQCYERPLWRACGDVDLFLSNQNYEKAKQFLCPLASSVEQEDVYSKHLGMTIDGWVVELHGHLYCGLSSRIDRELNLLKTETFNSGDVHSWDNDGVQIFLLSVENNVFYVFTHILQHFYKGGIGLRQICDWCRLIWTYRDKLNVEKLEARIHQSGLMSEWKAFAAFAVEWLGMPAIAMPIYEPSVKWVKKARHINRFILSVGNMGHNRNTSHFGKHPYLFRKCVSMAYRINDLINHARIFPLDSLRFFPRIMWNGMRSAMRGE